MMWKVSTTLMISFQLGRTGLQQHYARYERYEALECLSVSIPIAPRTDQFVAPGDND
jgi:hypothetical protein